jgi:hypothetical protein
MEPEQPVKPRKHRNQVPTLKQIRAIQLINQGYSKHKAMIMAGYSKYVAEAPTNNLMSKRGVKAILESMKTELIDAGLTSKYMVNKFKEWLEAQQLRTSLTEPDKMVPDYKTQLTAYKEWKEVMGPVSQKGIKRRVTFEEWIGDKKESDLK